MLLSGGGHQAKDANIPAVFLSKQSAEGGSAGRETAFTVLPGGLNAARATAGGGV